MPQDKEVAGSAKLDRVVAEARDGREKRAQSYRGRALKMFPWICGRCSREFTQANVHELTVHHRDHDHDNNPEDGSNWELLCIYCHDNEHSRYIEEERHGGGSSVDVRGNTATSKPFSALKDLLKDQDK
ncbi:MAG: YajD family HNH nuclease [Gammaproteobacteria bacterium]